MTFAIAGVSGHTGKVVAESLLARGKKVRVIVRDAAKGEPWKARGAEVAVADLGDTAALTQALRGAEGAFLLIPPSFGPQKYHDHQASTARSLQRAIADSGVPHVVFLSSIGAQIAKGTGPIAGLHQAENLFREISGTRFSFLRAAYFYENFGNVLPVAKDAGALPSFFPASFAFPMVSTGDIGRLAADVLVEGTPKTQILELGTVHTTAEIATTLGRILGKPVTVQEAPLDAVAPALTAAGLPADLAALYAEMTGALIDGTIVFEGGSSRRVESNEPLEQVFRNLLG